jgi:response regulator RpfG family c-di-GMP phosphodiesterase
VDHATAVEVIRRANEGEAHQFDPGLMPAFLHTAAKFDEIFAAYSD